MPCLSLLLVVIEKTILNPSSRRRPGCCTPGPAAAVERGRLHAVLAALLIPAGAPGDRYGRRIAGRGRAGVRARQRGGRHRVRHRYADRGAGRDGPGGGVPGLATPSPELRFPPRERPQPIAAWSAVVGVDRDRPHPGRPAAVALLVGQRVPHQHPAVALALAGVLLTVPETAEPGRGRLDFAGTLMVAGALFLIVDAIIEALTRGWTGWVTLAELAAGAAMLGLSTWWELHIPNPLIDLRVFAVRAFGRGCVGDRDLLRPVRQPVRADPVPPAGARVQPAVRRGARAALRDRHGRCVAGVHGPGRAARQPGGHPGRHGADGAGLLDLSTAGVHTSYPPLAIAVAIMGAGMGLVMAPASTTIMTTVPAHQAGAGSAVNDTIREVGGALGIAVVGSLAENVYRTKLGTALATAHLPQPVSHLASSSVAAADAVGLARGRHLRRAADRRGAHRVHHGHGHRHAGVRGGGPGRRDRRRVRAAGRRRPEPVALPQPQDAAPRPEQRGGRGVSRGAGGRTSWRSFMIMT